VIPAETRQRGNTSTPDLCRGRASARPAYADGMTEQPRTFTAPVAGRYHVATGQEPHLAQECTEACSMWDVRFVAPVTFRHVIVGETPSEELLRIYEAYLREHDMPVAGARRIPTAAVMNEAIDWWNQIEPKDKQHG
jgi:hypothetical protein